MNRIGSKKICIVSGSRADYGHLYPLFRLVAEDKQLELQIIATGTHFSPEYGQSVEEIENDGFVIDERLDLGKLSDTPQGLAATLARAIDGISPALQRLQPDLLILFGDRFEMLAAAQAALLARVLMLHIGGGDTTEGAYDESIRHCLTKISHVHCVTNQASAKRVLQLGENPQLVHNVGSLGLDSIRQSELLGKSELEKSLGITFSQKNLLVTYHPTTLGNSNASTEVSALLSALDRLGPEVGLIITKPNLDAQSSVIIEVIDDFAKNRAHVHSFQSLGRVRYLSAIRAVDAVVGNSSSGLYEVPFLKKPTVNIGDRQKGRLCASSVVNCAADQDAIYSAIKQALELDCSKVISPYGDGQTAEQILAVINKILANPPALAKHFFNYSLSS